MVKKAQAVIALIESGDFEGARDLAIRSDEAMDAFHHSGYTWWGTKDRQPCSCWFYERSPGLHDKFLDFNQLSSKEAWSLLLRILILEGLERDAGRYGPPLFVAPEEIDTFVLIHSWDGESPWAHVKEVCRIAEQARWGRQSGRKLAMWHGVPDGPTPGAANLLGVTTEEAVSA